MVNAASAAGGRTDVRERIDMGWLCNRALEDPDGHILELVWTDVAAMPTSAPSRFNASRFNDRCVMSRSPWRM